MPKETKANDATVEQRVNLVYDMLVDGATKRQIWHYVTTDEKAKALFRNISSRQLDRYIADAKPLIAANAAIHREHELGRAVAQLNNLYQRCMRVQDFGRALAVRRELSLLLGLHDETNKAPATVAIVIEHQNTPYSATYTLQPPSRNYQQSGALQGSGDGAADWKDNARGSD